MLCFLSSGLENKPSPVLFISVAVANNSVQTQTDFCWATHISLASAWRSTKVTSQAQLQAWAEFMYYVVLSLKQ